MTDVLDGVKTLGGGVVAMAVVVLIITVIVGPVASDVAGAGQGGNFTTDVAVEGGSEQIASDFDSFRSAETSLKDAVELTGANDSNVTIDADANVGTDFSTCTYARADSSVVTNNEDRILLATESAVLWYNGTDDDWKGYYYNVSSRNSYRANVSASSPTTNTHVCLNHNGSTLNVSANTTVGTDVTTGASNTAAYPSNISNWNGVVEETRIHDTPLNGSQRTERINRPARAVNGTAPAVRVTYDTRQNSLPSSFPAYFSGGSATARNASLVTGFDAPDATEGTDYSVSSGGKLSISSSTTLLNQDGEVLYVAYVAEGFSGPFAQAWFALTRIGPAALSLIVVGFLVVGATVVMDGMDQW